MSRVRVRVRVRRKVFPKLVGESYICLWGPVATIRFLFMYFLL